MKHAGKFQAGVDPRRNVTRGRGCTARSIAAVIRRTLGADAQKVCDQVKALAAAGDADAVIAAAVLLAAVVRLDGDVTDVDVNVRASVALEAAG